MNFICGLNVPHNGQPNMTSTTGFSLLKPSDHAICTATNGIRSQYHEQRYCGPFFIASTLLTVFKQCFTSMKYSFTSTVCSKKEKILPRV